MSKVFWIKANVLAFMEGLAIEAGLVETGGILLGYIGNNGEAVVTDAIGPGPMAQHYRSHFIPDDRYHREEMERRYWQSERMITYLGDWHSHPEGGAALSWKDRFTLGRIEKVHSPMNQPPFMVVLAREGEAWRLAPFQFSRRNLIPLMPSHAEYRCPKVY